MSISMHCRPALEAWDLEMKPFGDFPCPRGRSVDPRGFVGSNRRKKQVTRLDLEG